MTATLQQVCARAAEDIRRVGWWDGKGRCEGRSCLGIALNDAEEELTGMQLGVFYKEVADRLGIQTKDIPAWNDAQSSAEPVLALLDGIAGKKT